jgi:hypothetical protein
MKRLSVFLAAGFLVYLALAQAAKATDYYVASGVLCVGTDPNLGGKCTTTTSGGPTAGSDSNNGLDAAHPFLTLAHAFSVITTNGAGHRLILRGPANGSGQVGFYDTVNGILGAMPNGTAYGSGTEFTIAAYPGNCTAGSTVGTTSDCEKVMLSRSLAGGATHSVADLQNLNPTACRDRYNENYADCIGAPTQSECDHIYGAGAYSFPTGCWGGSGNNNGVPAGGWWLNSDRSGDEVGSVLDFANINFNYGAREIKYVVFDGVDCDARGVATNCWTNTAKWGDPCNCSGEAALVHHIRFKNLTWRNSAGSCGAQPGVNQSNNDFEFTNFSVHHCGIPYNTLTINGLNARTIGAAKFLHGWYFHGNRTSCFICDMGFQAGNAAGTEGGSITIDRAYLHDSAAYGHYVQGGNGTTITNSVFYNNGHGTELLMYNYGSHFICNNTFVAGPLDTGSAIQIQSDTSTICNNIFDGFNNSIDVYGGGNAVSNNLFRGTGTNIHNISGASLTQSNNLTTSSVGFVDAAHQNFDLTSGSAAIDHGLTNSLTYDYLGRPRPVNQVDIGAFEYGAVLGPTAPNTNITSSTTNGTTTLSDPTTATTAQFAFAGTGGSDGSNADSSYTFQVQIDGGSFSSSTSPKSYSSLTLAQHTFCVKATGNNSGLTDATPACITWTVQAVAPPDTSISSGPSSLGSDTSATFVFTSSGCTGTCTFTCSLDGASFSSCSSPKSYSSLSSTCNVNGITCDHTFQVRATDGGTGLTDTSPASYSWTINQAGTGDFAVNDCIQVISSGLNLIDAWPSGSFVAQDANGAIEKITATDATLNGSGFHGLKVTVQTGTNAGVANVWHSDNPANITEVTCPGGTAPDTSITSNPASSTTDLTASFAFTSSGGQTPVTFECNLDSAGYSACTSPKNYTGLSVAAHNFKVRAIGADTLTDSTPASYDWTITAPTPVITQSDSRFLTLRNGPAGTPVVLPNALKVIKGGAFQVEIELTGTVGNPDPLSTLLYYSKNGGSYTAAPDSFGADHVAFYGVADTSSDIKADGSIVPACVTSGLTPVGGAVSRRVASALTFDLAKDSCIALRWIVKLQSTAVAGDTYDFQVRKSDGSAIDAYSVTRRATVMNVQSSAP